MCKPCLHILNYYTNIINLVKLLAVFNCGRAKKKSKSEFRKDEVVSEEKEETEETRPETTDRVTENLICSQSVGRTLCNRSCWLFLQRRVAAQSTDALRRLTPS